MCTVDVSKAFDKVNHHGLLIKLMRRNLSVNFLEVIERWLRMCYLVAKWSCVFHMCLTCNLVSDRALSYHPFYFALYLDNIWNNGKLIARTYVILYADDILLISSSVCELQRTFDACERELMWLDY